MAARVPEDPGNGGERTRPPPDFGLAECLIPSVASLLGAYRKYSSFHDPPLPFWSFKSGILLVGTSLSVRSQDAHEIGSILYVVSFFLP